MTDGAAHEPPRTPIAVEARGVGRSFGPTRALEGVDLRIGRGEIRALLGPNGAGKTTLLRAIMGLLAPSEGTLNVLGEEAARRSPATRRRIGFVPSGDRSLYLRISGRENLRFFCRMQGLTRGDASRRSSALLDDVGLTDAADRPVRTYSHGMQKRLSVARALIIEPAVLLVDEATHDLDPENADRVRELVRTVAGRGAAVIWTTQRMEEIDGLADRATVLVAGRTVFDGATAALAARADTRRYVVRLESDGASDLPDPGGLIGDLGSVCELPGNPAHHLVELAPGAAIGDAVVALERRSVRVVACTQERPSVETAFLDITGRGKRLS